MHCCFQYFIVYHMMVISSNFPLEEIIDLYENSSVAVILTSKSFGIYQEFSGIIY